MNNSQRSSDDERFLHSYSPRAVEFDTEVQSSELGPQRNIGEETRTKITQKKFRGGGLTASIARVCYGTFEQKKAVIVVIRLLLHYPMDMGQLRRLEVKLSFKPQTETKAFPIVCNLSPRKVQGVLNKTESKWSYKTEQQCFNSRVAHNINSAIKNNGRNSSESTPRLIIEGEPWADRRGEVAHKACWDIKVKGEPIVGIPNEVNLAVAVEYEEAFRAVVKITLNLPVHEKILAVLAVPWSKDDPILFPVREPGPFIGEALKTTQFETLLDADWAALISGSKILRAEKVAVASTTAKAFRVQGIPAGYDGDAISGLVNNLFGLDNQKSDIELRSLGLDRQGEKVAIIISPRLEAVLSTGEQWREDLPDQARTPRPAGRRQIMLDTQFYGFTPLAIPEDEDKHCLDIIALPGLGGHAFRSFKERNYNYMWLCDDLPKRFPGARILIYGYDTKLQESQSVQDLEAIASTFRTSLKTVRSKGSDGKPNGRRILFIAHSLGGIVLKQALIQMAEGDEEDQANSRAIRGILFFGVPSQGMEIRSLMGMVQGKVNEHLLQGLRENSDMLRLQHRDFCKKFPYGSCKIMSFYETEYSPTVKKGPDGWKADGDTVLIVGQASATSGSRAWEVGPNYCLPIKRDHSGMVKLHPSDPSYSNVTYVMDYLVRTIDRPNLAKIQDETTEEEKKEGSFAPRPDSD